MNAKTILQYLKSFASWLIEPLLPIAHAFVGTRYAVVALSSTGITNLDASPPVVNSANIQRGNIREDQGLASLTNGDSIGSTYRLHRIRSSDRVSSIRYWALDIGTTGAFDLGLYDTAKNGGAVVDADFFASAVAVNAGPYAGVDITFEAGAAGGLITNAEKRIWEMLGLTADPFKDYDVTMTLTAATDATGTVLVRTQYVSGE